ncbi:organic hydroperoxide resistance protein [Dyadobacter sandarakinus]|uniref:Organic hydroperoxide resistance protein n=1 Tax=Dyadobacter sandarakinus TaxID=2747268 RepID=A0ABX7I4L0_9BACT|nr:organic hydroperoxide resistance protein [Dyadobacter sandarakinus]QRR00715.1 organic hydroperoxide resistance protein [Dyadobacter sandarakinus]
MGALYQTTVAVTGGRNGKVKSEDGILELEVRTPKELGGAGGHTNPEQLFAAGYAACFDSALNLVMGQAKVKPTEPSQVKATVGLVSNGQGGYRLDVALEISLPGIDKEQARQLVEKTHTVCPYSNAIHGNVDVALNVV